MLASQAYMKDRSVLQIHNSFWGQSKFKVAFEFFKVGISYIFSSFYDTRVLFFWRQNQRLAKKEIQFKKLYERGNIALNENKLSKKTTLDFL